MTVRSFVLPSSGSADLTHLPPSSPEHIRTMIAQAGLALPPEMEEQLVSGFPAFEAMVRRLPRARALSEEPAHSFDARRVAATPDAGG